MVVHESAPYKIRTFDRAADEDPSVLGSLGLHDTEADGTPSPCFAPICFTSCLFTARLYLRSLIFLSNAFWLAAFNYCNSLFLTGTSFFIYAHFFSGKKVWRKTRAGVC